MLERAAEALDRSPREEREIASVTLCVSDARLGELKARLERFRDEILQTYGAEESGSRVVQMNLQLFPLTVKEEA